MPSTTGSKQKKSFTLSRSSVAFLERLRKNRKVASTSRVLDEILQAEKARQQNAAMDASISEYYSNLSKADSAELEAWGEFAGEQFLKNIS